MIASKGQPAVLALLFLAAGLNLALSLLCVCMCVCVIIEIIRKYRMAVAIIGRSSARGDLLKTH